MRILDEDLDGDLDDDLLCICLRHPLRRCRCGRFFGENNVAMPVRWSIAYVFLRMPHKMCR